MTPSNFQIDISKKNLGKNFATGGPTPPNKNVLDPLEMCLQNFIAISLELWTDDVCEHSKNVILAILKLCPHAQGGPALKMFLNIFYRVRGLTPSNFQIDISKKILGKKFPPGGSDPQNFY